MSKPNTNDWPYSEPAFPSAARSICDGDKEGLTKREYIAAKAMAALIGNPVASQCICNNDPRYKKQADGQCNFADVVALNALEFADALLATLDKPV